MNQNKISLAKKTLKYLEKKKLRNINLKNFLSNNKVQHINNKIDKIFDQVFNAAYIRAKQQGK